MRFDTPALLAALTLIAVGCGGHSHTATPGAGSDPALPRPQTYGHAALTSQATRTVEVRMLDSLRFEPDHITVQRGEVVTFRLVNAGHLAHEFTVGGSAAQELHDDQMAQMGMSGEGQGMAMGGGDSPMKMPHDPAHAKYMKALAARIAVLDHQAAANDSVHVLPGETKDLTWAFTAPQLPAFACHIVGHWKAGMTGTIAPAP